MIYDNVDMVSTQGLYNNKKSNFAEQDLYYGPENKRECPCDTCPMNLECLKNATECSAMRNWCSKGDYWDTDGWDTKKVFDKKTKKKVDVKYWRLSDVQRLIRGVA
jgi:hypothetical protein